MKKIIILNQHNEILFNNAQMTTHFHERLSGLIGKPGLNDDSALCIIPCNGIHMFFMKYPIDVVFLNEKGEVIYLIKSMHTWTISKIVRHAQCVIEMPEKSIQKKEIELNDQLKVISHE